MLVLGSILYFLALPMGWTHSAPLVWDSAGHLHQAARIQQSLEAIDILGLLKQAFSADQYPPLHSLILGTWFAAFGLSVQSWLAFGFFVMIATLLLLNRISPLTSVIYLCYVLLGGLAPTLMVESLALMFLAAVFAFFHALQDHTAPRIRTGLALGLLMSGVILTKYNIGLPLIVALPAAALLPRDRHTLRTALIGSSIAAATFVLFLTIQADGWSMFFRFAENRSNSEDYSAPQRLLWYFRAFRDLYVVWAPWLAFILFAPLLALRSRPLVWTASVAYLVASLVVLSGYEYLLSRNLAGPAVALAIAAGCHPAWARPLTRFAVVPVCFGVVFAFLSLSERREMVHRYYPDEAMALSSLSSAVQAQLPTSDSTHLLGTFNEFSPGWVRLMNEVYGSNSHLRIDAPYPLESSRSGLDAQWDPRYVEWAQKIEDSKTDLVLGIEVDPTSPYFSEGYRAWSAWKRNLVRAVSESGEFHRIERTEYAPGVYLSVFRRVSPQ